MKRFVFLLLLFIAPAVRSFAVEPETIAHTKVVLTSDTTTTAPGSNLRLAVGFSMEKDWHVYWKNPGDSGLAPTIKWDVAPQITIGPIQWPIPHLISVGPLMSYGFENEVYLIVLAKVSKDWPADKPIEVKAKIDWLACKVECIPGSVTRQLTIPINSSGAQKDAAIAQRLDQEQLLWPVISKDIDVRARNLEKTIVLEIRPKQPLPGGTELYFFPERDDLIDHPAKQVVTLKDNIVQVSVKKSNISVANKIDRLQGVLVSSHGWGDSSFRQGIAVDVPLEQGAAGAQHPMTLLAACVFAFLGGMILNLMPCVLPVLSLKVLSLVKNAHNRRIMITHGLLFSFGVLTSFWVLAASLILLKSAGHQIGWGFQFQSPYFVVFMAALLYILALNLLGVFEFVPVAFSNEQFKKHPYSNSFFNGVLATTLATPCTAPFMGAAIGYALTQTNLIAFLIFTFLGIGMAFPYLFLSAFPQFLRWVPKPGSWMNNLKVFLGFILMGSVLWLAWVLGIQNGVNDMGLLLCGLLFVSLSGWIYGLIADESFSWQKFSWLLGSAMIGLMLLYASASGQLRGLNNSGEERTFSLVWQKYSPQLVEQLLAQKKPVFIDFTAAWCLTCQVNDRLVFDTKKVRQAFKNLSIELIKADWTSKDAEITRALEGYGKNSIPLYVYYPAGSIKAEVWPELITPQMVVDRLEPKQK